MVSKEERRREMERRARENYDTRNDSGGFGGKRAIDLSKIGGYTKDLFYRPKEGVNRIDIIPYVVKTDKHPKKVKVGYTDYLLDVFVHRRVGPSESTFLCLSKQFGKACPICEEWAEQKKNPDASEDVLNAMRSKRRCWYNVINVDLPEREQKIQIFEEAQYLFEKEVLEKAGIKRDGFVPFWDQDAGYTIIFRASMKKSDKGQFLEYRIDDFEKRRPISDALVEKAYSLDELLIIPSYDEVRKAHYGEDEDEENAKESDESPRSIYDDSKIPASEPERDERSERRREREARKSASKCPHGYNFGVDNDEHKECSECSKSVWSECADEHDRIEKR